MMGEVERNDPAGSALLKRHTAFFYVLSLFFLCSNIHLQQDAAAATPAQDFRIGYIFAVLLVFISIFQCREVWQKFVGHPEVGRYSKVIGIMILLSSVSGVCVLGRGFFNTFLLLSLVICVAYGYLFAFLSSKFPLERILSSYLFACKAAVILGAFQQVVWLLFRFDLNMLLASWGINRSNLEVEGFLVRADSFWQEPAHYGQFLSVASILAIFIILGPTHKKWTLDRLLSKGWAWAVVISMLLTFSLSALLPIVIAFICCVFMRYYRRRSIILFAPLVITCSASSAIQGRLVGLLFEFGDARFLNLSIWTLYSNFQTALVSMVRAPFGLGPGNHYWAYHYWVNQHLDINLVLDQTFLYQNARDGSSLLFRFMTEFGLLGVAFFGFWVWRLVRLLGTKVYLSNPYALVEMAGILGFMAFSLRQGAYSIFEPWLFLLIACVARAARMRSRPWPYLGGAPTD